VNIDLELCAKVISVINEVTGKVGTGGAVSNEDGRVGSDGLADVLKSLQGIRMIELPHCVVDLLNIHTHFLVS
jgi:hypothetical protein